MIRRRCAAVAFALLAASPCSAAPFDDGLHDRAEWERFYGQQIGEAKSGANFWAAQRSLARPVPCDAAPSPLQPAFLVGCQEARHMLDGYDTRRRTEVDYRRGWNAYTVPTPVGVVATQPLLPPSPASTAAPCAAREPDEARLACYDAAFGRAPNHTEAPARRNFVESPVAPPQHRLYRTGKDINMGCPNPSDAAAVAQMIQHGGSITTLVAKGNAYGCLSAGKGVTLELLHVDADTDTMLMRLPAPVFVLGQGKVTELWFAVATVESTD